MTSMEKTIARIERAHRRRLKAVREKHAAQQAEARFRSRVLMVLPDEDDFERRHRECGARVVGYVLRTDGEVRRCEAGHIVTDGAWDVVRVRASLRRPLAACSVGDVIRQEVLA